MDRGLAASRSKPLPPPTILVDNPEYQPGHPGSIRRVKVERALRNDPLGQMHARGQISEALYRAGRHYQTVAETITMFGRVRSVNFLQEPVDGSRRVAFGIVTPAYKRAIRQRQNWRDNLGGKGYSLCEAFLVDKHSVRECAALLYQDVSRPRIRFVGQFLRDCLLSIARDLSLST